MKILCVNQFFWPDVAPTGQFLADLTRHIGIEHEVTVICSAGAYAQAEEAGGEPPPVKIIRVPGFPYSRGVLARAASYSLFFCGALWHELRIARPDVVVTMTTPPMLGIVGSILKRLRGSRHYIWEMDVFPDALVSLGALSENGFIARLLGSIEDSCRRHSDGIVALGPCMRRRLVARGVPRELVHVAENWADGTTISPAPPRHSGPLNVFYSGNLGLSHDIETIAGAMRRLKNDSRFVFTFAGGGVGRTQIEQICKAEQIQNARFVPYAKRDQVGEHLAQADIGLVTERPACIGTVVPSKVYGLMAAAKPILFIGPRRATPGLVIRRFGCGWQIDTGNVDSLVELLEGLSANRDAVALRGQRARRAFERNYDLPHGVARVAAALGLARQTEPRGSVARAPANLISRS